MNGDRLARLRAALLELKLDGMLVSHGPNRRYMTGFAGSAGYALVSAEEALLLTDFRYAAQAAAQAACFQVAQHAVRPYETLAEHVRRLGIRRLGVEGRHLTLSAASLLQEAIGAGTECVPANDVVEKLRNVKDAGEIRTLERAAAIAEDALAHVLGYIRPGVTERRIAAELEYRMRLLGADAGWSPLIVASGERSALPHGIASDKEIAYGEFVTLDFGAIVDGYMSDVTRTVFVGRPSDRHREVYAAVLEANLAAIGGLGPGMTGKEGDSLGRDVIESRGYGEYFGHGLGHGIGLEIHEHLRLSRESESVLEPGNVLTVEPGIYIPGFGGVRIEDDVLVTETGIRVLTSSSKELLVL